MRRIDEVQNRRSCQLAAKIERTRGELRQWRLGNIPENDQKGKGTATSVEETPQAGRNNSQFQRREGGDKKWDYKGYK